MERTFSIIKPDAVAKGVIGKMPAFNRLNVKQKEAVGAYINSLSK